MTRRSGHGGTALGVHHYAAGRRDVEVVRDSTALAASVAGGTIGLGEEVYTLDAPLIDTTSAAAVTEELRLSGSRGRVDWVGGFFYSDAERRYGQSLPITGFEAASGIPTQREYAARDELFFSGAQGVAPRFIASYDLTDAAQVNAQISKGFRLGGINDPLNVPICTPRDLQTFGNRDTWEDEELWNYEAGAKSTFLGGQGTLNISGFYMDIRNLQATVTAGSCSSRIIFNVPESRSAGMELEIETGKRLPTTPLFQTTAAATWRWLMGSWVGYLSGTVAARRIALHPDRRPGGRLRRRQPSRAPEHDRRPAHARDVPVRTGNCRPTTSSTSGSESSPAPGTSPSWSTTSPTSARSWHSIRSAERSPGWAISPTRRGGSASPRASISDRPGRTPKHPDNS